MAETVRLLDPRVLVQNPENPRLIFREDELKALEDSIRHQGILVPLTVFAAGRKYILLDGERRWRCAIKLALSQVPVIVQPQPTRIQNIMMMFAIHNARKDWDPLPTAYKLRDLEREFTQARGKRPTEAELAELASMSRGEVRRLKKLLALPEFYRNELMAELERPRSEQTLTVDHVLEATKGAGALRARGVVDATGEDALRRAIIAKFKVGTIRNTVEPRKLARIARAVDRREVSPSAAAAAATQLVNDPKYTIEDAFQATIARGDYEHATEQLVERLVQRLQDHLRRGDTLGERLSSALDGLRKTLEQFHS